MLARLPAGAAEAAPKAHMDASKNLADLSLI